jgi:exosortase/archaeosortase family protein
MMNHRIASQSRMITTVERTKNNVAERATGSPLPKAWFMLWAALLLWLLAPPIAKICGDMAQRSLNDNFIQFATVVVGAIGAWRLCKSCKQIPASSSVIGTIALVITAAANFLMVMLHTRTLYDISIIAMVAAFILAVRGPAKARHFLPLLLFSFFLIPDMPDDVRLKISLPLQMITTNGTVTLAHLFIPISSIGHTFIINGHPFDVAPGCSGLNMWISFLFAFGIWQLIERFRPTAYVVMCAAILATTIALNVVRLLITALVAYYVCAQQALAIHTNLEAVLVPLGLILLFYLGGRLRSGEQTIAA